MKRRPGLSRNERVDTLEKARQFARSGMYFTFAVSAWGFLYPRPYATVVFILALIPPAAMIIAWRSNGLYLLDEHKNDAHPNLAIPFLLPGAVLALRAITAFHLVTWSRAGILALLAGLIVSLIAVVADKSFLARPVSGIALVFCTSMYGLGVSLQTNGLLAQARPQTFSAFVISKEIMSTRRTEYKLVLPSWGPFETTNKVEVSRALYDSVQPGDRVCPVLYQGALRIPWYVVERCH